MSVKRAIEALAAILAMTALAVFAGCSSDTSLGGAKVPNALPDTRISAQPPSLRDANFVIHFFWSGSDPDGKLRGYQWKISDNGTDGISLRDTLTIDPATGDTLHAWHFTTATDSTFIVKADLPGLPDDTHLPPRDQRSYQTHTLFVRAIDDQGGVDPTPAMISFTSTTLAPTIIVDRPQSLKAYTAARFAPPTMTFGWSGSDPDFELGVPTKVRYLWKKALLKDGSYIDTQYRFLQNLEQICSFSDSAWSDWMPYKPKAEDRTVTFRNQPQKDAQGRTIGYLFAIQAQDTAGAVSPDRSYAVNVHNVTVSYNMTPKLTVRESYLGSVEDVGVNLAKPYDIAQNQPLNFSWVASSEEYAGTVTSYRYGWDVQDPSNENDPGWALQAGSSLQHLKSPTRSFSSGTHTLTVQAWDDSGQLTRITIILNVVPVPDPGDQLPVLVVDDLFDSVSNGWLGLDGRYYDTDLARDAFWDDTLTGTGGVVGYLPSRDSVGLENYFGFGYRDVVRYRSLIWEAKMVRDTRSYTWTNFDPRDGDKFIWLGTYQQQVGHVLLCGQQALYSFLGDYGMLETPQSRADWMTPIILDTSETYYTYLGKRYALGSGTRQMPDGTMDRLGLDRYPYNIWGVDALDSPSNALMIYPGLPGQGQNARKSNCAGLMALVLDPSFKAAHLDAGAIDDTINTWRNLLKLDDVPPLPHFPNLRKPFSWQLDEFYDHNPTGTRSTPINIQTLPGGGPAYEPMFRFMTRYEWIRNIHVQRGDTQWPLHTISPDTVNFPYNYDKFNIDDLRNTCSSGQTGPGYLFSLDQNGIPRTRIDGAPVGLLSHKTEATKPTPGGDVIWGFDPSRFDPPKIKKAIRWVLGEEFRLRMAAP